MIQHRDGSVALFRLEETLRAARIAAANVFREHQRCLNDRVLADEGRPVRVVVQSRKGTFIDGRWEDVSERRGGFDRFLKAPRKEKKGQGRFKSGDMVACELLPDKTRSGGWRAVIAGARHVGPVICHNPPPENWEPGMTVRLRLSSLSRRTGNAQFSWA